MTIKFLIEKEFKQLFRNPFLPRMILIFPCMIMLLMPWAASLEIKNINLNVVDNDHSILSRKLVDKIGASTYFRLNGVSQSYNEGLKEIERGTADIILEIPRDFEKDWITGNSPHVLVAANAVNGTKGGLGSAYLSAIVAGYSTELIEAQGSKSLAKPISVNKQALANVEVTTLNLFNPNLDYKLFMVPALMVMLLTLLCGFLPALNIVSEKEVGTIEQINVTPIGKFTFILAKLISYWVVGFLVLTLCFALAWLLYGIFPAGSFLIIYLFAVLFVLGISGFGIVISNYSATMQQAMFVMWFFLLILILMSGLFTPIRSMPQWAQWITVLNPLKYLMQVMRAVYLRGSVLSELFPQLIALILFAVFFNSWAVKSYRKSK
ncbi:ABC transporter permease [Bacteroidaceae bacterium HV4-6-C5C]|nr:ABC transporter permease [Bacteroidaceae bacterium HV4-6-C5C]